MLGHFLGQFCFIMENYFSKKNIYQNKVSQKVTKLFSKKKQKCVFLFFFFQKTKIIETQMSQKVTKLFSKKKYDFSFFFSQKKKLFIEKNVTKSDQTLQ